MGMKSPFICEIAPDTYAVNEFGMDAMFLCIGKERALLIDTGTGTFDLKQLVRRLTDLPYDVVLTHGHVDHAGGMDLFDRVYMHEKDMEMALNLTYEERHHYASSLSSMDKEKAYDFSLDMVRRWEHTPELIPVDEGYVFDLGDRKLEVFFMPGHTAGSITLLDRKNRIHFSGDACNINTLCMGSPVETLLHTAQRIKAMEPLFDQDYNGHLGYAGMPECRSQAKYVRDSVIMVCRSILDHTAEPEDTVFLGRQVKAVSAGGVRVVFDPANLYE